MMADNQDKNSFKRTDLILIGKTGHGKSSSGNTILEEEYFSTSPDSSSATKTRKTKVKLVQNRILSVTDTPGLADTDLKNETDKLSLVTEEIKAIIEENPKGFDACLIVLKFGSRFTKEEQCCIEALKNIFGDDFAKDHCIIIMTGGDDFEYHQRRSKISFSGWCGQQTGDFKSFLADCGGKIVLFNNRKTGEEGVKQVQELLTMVDRIGGKYTDKHFQKAQKSREIMMLKSKLPGIRDDTMKEITNIHQQLHEVEKSNSFKDIKQVITLHGQTKALLDKLVTDDNETGVLDELIQTVQALDSTLSVELKVRERVLEEIEKNGKPEIVRSLEALQLQNLMALLALHSKFERELSDKLNEANSKSSCLLM